MIGKVKVSSRLPFELDGTQPKRLCVRCASPPEHATQTYSVVADYGWAERILCSDAYLRDANDIAETIAEGLLVPAELAE